MAYEKINFVNGTAPPINATFLNTLQDELIAGPTSLQAYNQAQSVKHFTEATNDGFMSEINLKGLTLDDLVVKGDVTTSVISDDTGTLIDINTDGTWELSAAYDATNQTFNIVSGNQYFLYGKLLDTSVGDLSSRIFFRYSDASTDSVNANVNGFNEVSGRITATKTLLANFKFVEGNTGQIDKDYQMLIDMTSRGITSFSDAKMLDLARQGYFEDIKNVDDEIKSIGKNLFKENWIFGEFLSSVDGKSVISNGDSAYDNNFYKIDESQTYVVSSPISYNKTIYYYDSAKNFISSENAPTTELSLTIPVDTKFIRISGLNVGVFSNLDETQTEQGTATDYETYRETISPLTEFDGKSVSDGTNIIQDTTDGIDVIRNVVDGSTQVQSATSWTISNILTITHRFGLDLSSLIGYKLPADNATVAKLIVKIGDLTFTNVDVNSTINDIENQVAVAQTNSFLYFQVNKTTFANTAAFETYLKANKVTTYFEAETPIIEKLVNSIAIQTDTKGQVIFEGIFNELDGNVPINLAAQVNSNVNEISKLNNDLNSLFVAGSIVKNAVKDKTKVVKLKKSE